jgi:taurine dioxygenase
MAIETRSLHPEFGVEIAGVDLRSVDPPTFDEIHRLWQAQPLVLIRDQLLTERALLDWSARFGALEQVVRKDVHSRQNPEIILVSNLYDEEGQTIGGLGSYDLRWHTDQSYRRKPATGAIFFALEVPEKGGKTFWANTSLAYRELSPETKRRIENRRGLFAYTMYDTDITDEPDANQIRELTPDAVHPMVLTHPGDGSRSIYLDPTQTFGIEGMEREESETLLAELKTHIVKDDFVYGHDWRIGDVMMWDNGRLLHRRDPFDRLLPRLAKRTTIFLPSDQFPVPCST